MSLFVEAMYANRHPTTNEFIQVRVPLTEAATLSTNNILFIIISAETTPGKSRRIIDGKHYRRRFQVHGEDYYALVEDASTVSLVQWSNKEFKYIAKIDPDSDTKIKMDDPPHMPADAIVFIGAQVSADDWDQAVNQFETQMH